MMISKAAAESIILSSNDDQIVVSPVKGDKTLFRVMVNAAFKGYVQKQDDGLIYRVAGSQLSDQIFQAICEIVD